MEEKIGWPTTNEVVKFQNEQRAKAYSEELENDIFDLDCLVHYMKTARFKELPLAINVVQSVMRKNEIIRVKMMLV